MAVLLLLITLTLLFIVYTKLRGLRSVHATTLKEHEELKEKFKGIEEHEQALRSLESQSIERKQELKDIDETIRNLTSELELLSKESDLYSVGFYTPHYDFASSGEYQTKLEEIREQQKLMLRSDTAAFSTTRWTVNGSESEGRKQIKQTLKLMLRAFNGECDAAVTKVKYNNVMAMETRMRKAYDSIITMGKPQSCVISEEYLGLKLQELYLAHEYQEKIQAEKEEQRLIREQMREEEKAQREIEKAQLEAEREENRYQDALQKAREEAERSVGDKQQALLDQIQQLQSKLEDARINKERALSRAQMTRSGHVYVISNVGSFGDDVYKIGMTRRLDPMDRVRELGDASVPFDFDVHAIIYTEDAPALEATLHRAFHHRRVNRINERKEFFKASLNEIANIVRENHGEIEFTMIAEARDFRMTLALMDDESQGNGSVPSRAAMETASAQIA